MDMLELRNALDQHIEASVAFFGGLDSSNGARYMSAAM